MSESKIFACGENASRSIIYNRLLDADLKEPVQAS